MRRSGRCTQLLRALCCLALLAWITTLTTAMGVASFPPVAHDDPDVTRALQKVLASDGSLNDFFGYSVAISGDTAVIGAKEDDDGGRYRGSAYIFTRTGDVWTQQAKLRASDGAAGDRFGWSVAISGDTVVVGAFRNENAGSGAGSAYVFTRSGDRWSEQAKLTDADDTCHDWFGDSVAVSGDTVVVAAPQDDERGAYSGSAYVFTRSGGVWSRQAELIATDGAPYDSFGSSVAVSGDTVLVGANNDDGRAGSVRVFRRSGDAWSPEATLRADVGSGDTGLGDSVSLSGDTAAVGLFGFSGSAYVFERSGGAWVRQARLTASGGSRADLFGSTVAVSGDKVIVGAYYDDDKGNDSGAAYVFERAGGVWLQRAKVSPPDGTPNDWFGSSVSISGDNAIIGVNHQLLGEEDPGAAYLFGAPAAYSTNEDSRLAVPAPGVIGNDIDPDSAVLSAQVLTQPAHGSAQIGSSGEMTYTPDPDFNGVDTFTYRAFDGASYSSPAAVKVVVAAVNDVPRFTGAGNVTVRVNSGEYSRSWASSISAGGGADEAQQHLTFDTTYYTRPDLFSDGPTVATDGTLSFTPAADATGSAQCTVTITDDDTAGGKAKSYAVPFTIAVVPIPRTSLTAVSDSATLESYGASYLFTGKLEGDGAALAGQRVVVQAASSLEGPYSDTTFFGITGADGLFSVALTPQDAIYYRAHFAGEAGEWTESTSEPVNVVPRAWVSVPEAAGRTYVGVGLAVSGTLKPTHVTGTQVRVYMDRLEGGQWAPYGYVDVSTSASETGSVYSGKALFPKAGKWRIHAWVPADAEHAAAEPSAYHYVTVGTRGDRAVAVARSHIGLRYKWGTNGPSTFDSSGFVQHVYGHVGIAVPRKAYQQAKYGRRVSRSELRPGDIVIFRSPLHHVGIYVGSGRMIDCSLWRGSVRERALYPGFQEGRRVW